MSKTRITAAVAAAMIVTAIGTAHAAPSTAWELNLPPATSQRVDAASAPAPAAAPAVQAPQTDDRAAAPQPQPQPQPDAETAPAATPAPAAPATLAGLVSAHASSAPRDAEEACIAGAVYFEAKGEPLKGQLSVAEVIINRARSGRFPATACGVVRQRGQFSFIRGGGFPPIARGSAAWRTAVAIARVARGKLAAGGAPKALFFHARRVAPSWRGVTRVASIGNHVFYR
ncbi:MAG: cell wall hydrolase [Alphaproteobacteria bacterium]|nr:cell wall hydrolase [Alphaproteobacteria bacterium]MBV9371751.1 cell wall hydrolase [Alphaproteobacteria bacterium]MBV9900709.1 cell wall hydrolase [Alphaproteobacteria bacterium]